MVARGVVGVIDGDGEAALGVHHLHGRHVGVAVAEEDHPVERDGAFLVGDEAVDALVVPVVVHALVDAEQVLGLGGVVDADGGPDGDLVFVIGVFRGEDVGEGLGDGAALDHLLQTRRDDVVLNLKAVLGAEFIHAVEPGAVAQTLEQGHVAAVIPQRLARDGRALLARRLQHHLHVHQDAVAVGGDGPGTDGLVPELGRRHPDRGNEADLLHIAPRQGAVEIIDDGGLEQGAGRVGHGVVLRAWTSPLARDRRKDQPSSSSGAAVGAVASTGRCRMKAAPLPGSD
ncbi:hypothetical protein D3C85_770940 [compost metagenome]